ncbi:MAG TPA: hypothetical protein VLF67_02695, partial [Candidatus Saccharimonas sp.]|nr:hypothetical protein [Candidatus Saccharimonas sp.]
VYPLFTYFLVSALPAMWYSDWGLAPWFRGHPQWVSLLVLAPLLGAGLWVYDGLVSDRRYDAVADAVRIQSWSTGEVSGPLRLIPTTPCSTS